MREHPLSDRRSLPARGPLLAATRALILLVALPLALLPLSPAAAQTEPDDEVPTFTWEAEVDGHVLDTEGGGPATDEPVTLVPGEDVTISVSVTNTGSQPLEISSVRFEGRVLDLAFFSYRTRVDLEAGPGETDSRTFSLDTVDLHRQATGLLPSRLVLLDGVEELRAVGFPVDVEAPLRSVYGTFGLAVGAVTGVLLWGVLWGLATGRLHENRWRRGTAFAVPGLGLGLTLTFTVSALGWRVPSPATWATFLLVGGLVGFVGGYLSPTPLGVDELDEEESNGPPEETAVGEPVRPGEPDAAPAEPLPVIDLRGPDEADRDAWIPGQASGHRDAAGRDGGTG